MFNLSGSEIVVILLLALVVLGPEKLPDAIRKFGRTYAELKKMGTGFQQEFKSAIDEPLREMRETADLLKKSADFTTTTTDAPTKPVTDTVTDRPTRNEGIATAAQDVEPTDNVPFADDGPVAGNVSRTDHDTVADDTSLAEASPDGQAERGEADNA